jgi:hypothetical protein
VKPFINLPILLVAVLALNSRRKVLAGLYEVYDDRLEIELHGITISRDDRGSARSGSSNSS